MDSLKKSMDISTPASYRYSHTVGLYTQRGRGFSNPVDVAIGNDGTLYVISRASVDSGEMGFYKRVTVCTVDGEYVGEFSGGGTGDGQIMWPAAIAIDKDENIYVSDEALHRISIFDKERRFVGKWGVKGRGDAEFNRPAGIALDW